MKLREFTSIGFITALIILLLNDFFLKSIYGNWFTGKLSDFAGLFIFPLFWSILFPKLKNVIYVITALIFIYWKSYYSNFIIEFINHYSILNLSRTVDLTDLLALIILPLSYLYQEKETKKFTPINPIFIIILSSFSFFSYKLCLRN